jgi:hypothetical protein
VSGRVGLSAGAALLVVVGTLSVAGLVGLLARQVVRERERTEHSRSARRGSEVELAELRRKAKEAEDRRATEEEEDRRRAQVAEGEQARLRRELAAAVEARDAHAAARRAAEGERDKAMTDLLAARRDLEALRDDLARAADARREAERRAESGGVTSRDAARRLAELQARAAALLRPLVQDLRSADGALRVRAHEALCAWAGRDLPFRANGTPEERDADAAAIEASLRQGDR